MPATITLSLPATIQDVTLGQYLAFLRVLTDSAKAGSSWSSIRFAKATLSAFSGLDEAVIDGLDYQSFVAAYNQLTYLSDFGRIKAHGEYSGGTLSIGGEAFTLPTDLDHLTTAQAEVIEKTLKHGSMFQLLDYVLAILTMWDSANLLRDEAELQRRAKLFREQLLFSEVIGLGFFLTSGGATSPVLTQFCTIERMLKTNPLAL